jgi:hypothetical protein
MLSEKCGIEGYRTRSESIFSGNGICACAPSKIKEFFFFYVERVNIKDFFFLYSLVMQIFLDMAVLVDAQGDMLDNIESQVSSFLDKIILIMVTKKRLITSQKINQR